MSTYKTLLTNVGLAKLTNAQALGQVVQWSAMAVGDGNGNPTTPVQTQTALVRERYRAGLNQLAVDSENPNYLIAEMIIPAQQGGWTVHEVGIFDSDGDLVAIANAPATYKPVLAEGSTSDLAIRIIVQVSNAATVELKIDPTVILASRKWVIDNYVEKTRMNGGTTNQVLRKKSNANLDMEWADPMAAVQVIVASPEETQTLAAAQVIIDLAIVTTEGCAVYIEGVRLREDQFTRNTATRLTLAQAYPAGSKVVICQNEEVGSLIATESVRGMVKLATQELADARADDAAAITAKKMGNGFATSQSASGYVKLPSWMGGLIIQWGSAPAGGNGGLSVTFPIAFPNSVFSIAAMPQAVVDADFEIINFNNLTSSGFLALGDAGRWIAIGH